MRCDLCRRKAQRYEVSVWDISWNWPIKTEVTRNYTFSLKIGKRLSKLGPNVGMSAYCLGHK